ncbi:MAG TPA: hypothetical protein VF608_01750 [Thermoanaerobaculia bacterium]
MLTIILLLSLLSADDGAGIDPHGGAQASLDAGSSMDPNGLNSRGTMDPDGVNAGARIDDNGVDSGWGIDPNG